MLATLSLLLALFSSPARHAQASLIAEATSVQAGKSANVALRLQVEDKWHIYWKNPGIGLPPELTWLTPTSADSFQWPTPEVIHTPPLVTYGYHGDVTFPFTVAVPDSARDSFRIKAIARWQVCHDICLLEKDTLELTLPIAATSPALNPTTQALFAKARETQPKALSEWSVRAWANDSFLVLEGKGTGRQELSDQWRLIPEIMGIIDDSAQQKWSFGDKSFVLRLARDLFGEDTPDSLTALLKGAGPDGFRFVLAVDSLTDSVSKALDAPVVSEKKSSGWVALLIAMGSAFLGGLILNLMPCVLPVLGLKVLDFLGKAGKDKRLALAHGGVFTLGVLVSFWILAGTLLILRASGEALGWGFQLQNPLVVAGLSVLMMGLALNLWGVFEPGAGLASIGSRSPKGPWISSFATGVTATIVATPCTAPFMGAALGYTLTQGVGVSFLVFTALGLGMAAPVLILSGSPALLKRIPRPGAWMETLKQSFGFLMAATALWLAWVLGQLVGANAVVSIVGFWLLLGIAAWILGRWAVPHEPPRVRMIARLTAYLLMALLVALGVRYLPHQAGAASANAPTALAEGEEAFRPGIVEELRASGKPWFLHYTAAWCLSCKVNEFNALNRDAVHNAMREKGVRQVKADWTSKDSVIAASLAAFGRQGVPFYVLSDGKTETILPEVLTEQIVLDAVAKIPAPSK